MLPNEVQLINGDEEPGPESFMICQAHHERMIELLKEFGIEDQIAKTDQEVQSLLSMGKSDPILDITRVLMNIAVNAMSSVELAKLKCPLCAFQQFDFLAKITGLVAIKYRDNPLGIIKPGEPKLILPS